MSDLPSWCTCTFNTESPFIGCSMMLRRNIEPYFFSGQLSEKEKKECTALIKSALDINLFSQSPPQSSPVLSSLFHLPPSSEILLHHEKPCLVSLHTNDHFSIGSYHTSSIEDAYQTITALIKPLSSLKLAFNKQFGYLTASPHHCGTGLNATATLHLPALIHTQKFLDEIEPYTSNLSLSGWFEKNTYTGDLVTFTNQYCLGIYEEDIVRDLQTATDHLVAKENEAVTELQSAMPSNLSDKIAKSLGILEHCKSMSKEEALVHLSLIDLGLKTSMLTGSTPTAHKAMEHILFQSDKQKIAQELNAITAPISETKP